MRLVVNQLYYFTCENDKDKFRFLMNKYNFTFKTLACSYGCSTQYIYSVYSGKKPVHRNLLDFFRIVFEHDPVLYELFDFEVL